MFTSLQQKNPDYFMLLSEQHRMHPKIAEFPNNYFYERKLKNAVSEEERSSVIPYFQKYPLSFIDLRFKEQ